VFKGIEHTVIGGERDLDSGISSRIKTLRRGNGSDGSHYCCCAKGAKAGSLIGDRHGSDDIVKHDFLLAVGPGGPFDASG
jgi:hypothetical protein